MRNALLVENINAKSFTLIFYGFDRPRNRLFGQGTQMKSVGYTAFTV